MKPNKTIIGNYIAISELEDFKKLITEYFENISYSDLNPFEIFDTRETLKLREKINQQVARIQSILCDIGEEPSITYKAPPAIGSFVVKIKPFENVFHLAQYDIYPQALIDFLDNGIGRYKDDKVPSILRTFNPFYWLGRLLEAIASVPFYLIGSVGFDEKKISESFIGKLIKLSIKVLTTTLLIWDLLYRLDLVNPTYSILNR